MSTDPYYVECRLTYRQGIPGGSEDWHVLRSAKRGGDRWVCHASSEKRARQIASLLNQAEVWR